MEYRSPFCVRVAVCVPVRGSFSYLVPESLAPVIKVGCRVLVPFRNRTVTGFVMESMENPQTEKELKEVLELVDREPLFHERMARFFEWMADYYVYPLGQLIQFALPGGMNMNSFKTAVLTEEGIEALERSSTDPKDREILSWIKQNPGRKLPVSLKKAYSFEKKGWVSVEEKRRTKKGAGPLIRKFVRPKPEADRQRLLSRVRGGSGPRNEPEFLERVFEDAPVLLAELKSEYSNADYLVRKWVGKGAIECCEAPVLRNLSGEILRPSAVPEKLFRQQEEAVTSIRHCLDKGAFSSFLLYGITGSGKTEVYYRAVEHALSLGRRAILMVPEIALATHMESMFRYRLGEKVALYHSGLSRGERYDQWLRMSRGEADVVIGARSALFSPMQDLGLIIVDEEHDPAYKQESGPRYQARDCALVRAKLEDTVVILGSGTPSVQSYQNSLIGKYKFISMPKRVEKRPLPEVEIVDMKTVETGGAANEMISPALREALEEVLEAGNQAMVFLNRRGFHRLYLCRRCGQVVSCPNCDVALTYHLYGDALWCHYCGYQAKPDITCSSCGRGKLKAYGFGTERVVEELKDSFPGARIARMDTDSTRRKGEAFNILKRFGEHDLDILVGTQMITKGHDFHRVTLVGVISADLSLNFPDFRAGERTFQILSQVAGRAGRGAHRGKVLIQTFNPGHYAISAATKHDYGSFFEQEKTLRNQVGYPPFRYLACLRLEGNSQERTAQSARELGERVASTVKKWAGTGKEIQALGPAKAPVARIKGKHRWQILVKSEQANLLTHLLNSIEALWRRELHVRGVKLVFDVDPYQMT